MKPFCFYDVRKCVFHRHPVCISARAMVVTSHEFRGVYPVTLDNNFFLFFVTRTKVIKPNTIFFCVEFRYVLTFFPIRQGFQVTSCWILKNTCIYIIIKVKVKWSRYRPGLAQRVGRGIALLFHDRVTIRGWGVSSTPQSHFTPGKDPVPILQEDGWAPGPAWTGGKSRLHRDSIPDRPARIQSLYRLSYPGLQV